MRMLDFKKDLKLLEIGLDNNGLPVTDQTNLELIKHRMYILNHKLLNLQVILPDIRRKTVLEYTSILYTRSFRLNRPMVISPNS